MTTASYHAMLATSSLGNNSIKCSNVLTYTQQTRSNNRSILLNYSYKLIYNNITQYFLMSLCQSVVRTVTAVNDVFNSHR